MKKSAIRIIFTMLLTAMFFALPIMSSLDAVPVQAASSAKLSVTKLTLVKGKSKTIKVKGGKASAWKSSNSKVATVSKGKVKAVGYGICDITATVGKSTLTCKLQVVPSQKEAASKILAMKKEYPEDTKWTDGTRSYTFKNRFCLKVPIKIFKVIKSYKRKMKL